MLNTFCTKPVTFKATHFASQIDMAAVRRNHASNKRRCVSTSQLRLGARVASITPFARPFPGIGLLTFNMLGLTCRIDEKALLLALCNQDPKNEAIRAGLCSGLALCSPFVQHECVRHFPRPPKVARAAVWRDPCVRVTVQQLWAARSRLRHAAACAERKGVQLQRSIPGVWKDVVLLSKISRVARKASKSARKERFEQVQKAKREIMQWDTQELCLHLQDVWLPSFERRGCHSEALQANCLAWSGVGQGAWEILRSVFC